jgi:hypothetical protein
MGQIENYLDDILEVLEQDGGGGGGTTVVPLSVTENGTYTALSGTAYSPVTVSVPSGGGETADVTINSADSALPIISCPYISDDTIKGAIFQGANSSIIYSVPLGENGTHLFVEKRSQLVCIVQGNCSIVENEWFYEVKIVGDCTIDLSYSIN